MMAIRMLVALIFSVMATTSVAKEGCTAGSEFDPPLCPLRLPQISSLSIQKNAAKSTVQSDGSVSCDRFKITESDVRRYLANAKTTTEEGQQLMTARSPCYANGEIVFRNGKKGKWKIDQLRVGSISIDGADSVILYCQKCTFRPFRW